jgi:glycosyltransferase involved in cell wall biosynthesis
MLSERYGMSTENRTCVLIPSYNEARTIGGIVKGLRGMEMSVYVVDDGSTDETAGIAEKAGATVLRHAWNKGKGASLVEGFGRIVSEGYDRVAVMDGDGQHSLDDIQLLMKRMDETGADIVIGSRMGETSEMPFVRICVNRFMSGVLSRIVGQPIPDSQSGFRLINRRVMEGVRLETSNYETESEILIKAGRAGLRIESVPIKTIYQGQKSRINPVIDAIRFIRLLFRALLAGKK